MEGRYRIEQLLGQGGSGAVYRAQHVKLDRPVAVKVLHPVAPQEQAAAEAAFEEEARLAASLEHPNLARVLDFFENGRELVLVTEFIDGQSMDHLGNQPEKVVLGWIDQVMDALEYLHSRQPPVIVRDLKPANLMLGKDGRVRLIDFGISKRLKPGQVTQANIRGMGTAGFAPLEQYGGASTDQRSDLYALGATCWALLSGDPPPDAVARATQNIPLPDPPPYISDATYEWMRSLLALRPDRRPASVAEARALLHPAPVKPRPAPTPRPPAAQTEPEWMSDFR